MAGFVYILCNQHENVLYTGVTSNLGRRVFEHKTHMISGFTAKYNVTRLVYYEQHEDIRDAIGREKVIKRKSTRGKHKLIEELNPHWEDLAFKL